MLATYQESHADLAQVITLLFILASLRKVTALVCRVNKGKEVTGVIKE